MHSKGKDLLSFPPSKVVLMYHSVIAMINEGCDVNSIKVADITARAGIGKGTAYEYFSTKEEIIMKALLYEMMSHMQQMHTVISDAKAFEQKIKDLLAYVADHFQEGKTFFQVLRIALGAYNIPESLQQEFCQIKEEQVYRQYIKLQGDIMKAGLEEQVLKEEDVFRQQMAFDSQMMSFAIFLSMDKTKDAGRMSLEEAKQFTYDGIVKLLG